MKFPSLSHLGCRAGIAALALAATVAGCSSDSGVTAPDTTGRFSALVNAGTQTSLTGAAGLISLPAADSDSAAVPSSAVLILQDGTSNAQLGFQWIGTSVPATGTYPIGAGDLDVAMAFQDSTGAVFDGISGTVTVATVTKGLVGGTFSVTAQPTDSAAHNAVITGTFKAPIAVQ